MLDLGIDMLMSQRHSSQSSIKIGNDSWCREQDNHISANDNHENTFSSTIHCYLLF